MHIQHALVLACTAAVTLAACDRDHQPADEASAEMAWARAALERNPNLEVVAADGDTGVLTVRDRASGEVQAVNLADLAAAPVADLAAESPLRPAPVAAEPPSESAAVSEEAVEDSDADAGPVDEETIDYTVDRQGGKLRVSGPGISIVSSDTPATATARAAPDQRPSNPFICEGPRMMRFDDRQVFVDGNAVIARDGCELHITNSRIVASGTGVVVRDATVHITNSHIEGAAGSYDAGPGAKIFLRGVTLSGTLRRDETAQIQELSGRL